MKTVLCFGDSNTHGTMPMASITDRRRHPRDVRWTGVLAAELGADWEVIAEGNPGRTTVYKDPIVGDHRSGLLVLPSLLESHETVDLVVLKLGTNDFQSRFSCLAIDVARAVDKLVATVLQSDCGPGNGPPSVLVVAPPPVVETGGLAEIFTGAAEKSAKMGAYLGAVAAKRGAAFLDAGDLIEVSPVDGGHYEAETHATLGRAIADAIRGMG
jgi:lysophospholipase L1-like esterase